MSANVITFKPPAAVPFLTPPVHSSCAQDCTGPRECSYRSPVNDVPIDVHGGGVNSRTIYKVSLFHAGMPRRTASSDFGPPTDFGMADDAHVFSSHASFSMLHLPDSRPGSRGQPVAAAAARPRALPAQSQQPQAPPVSHESALGLEAPPRAMQANKEPNRSVSVQEMHFQGEPLPPWIAGAPQCPPPPPGALYSADFSASTQSILNKHMVPMPSAPIAPISRAAPKPYRPPGMPASTPGQHQQQFTPEEEAWYAQAIPAAGAGLQQAPLSTRSACSPVTILISSHTVNPCCSVQLQPSHRCICTSCSCNTLLCKSKRPPAACAGPRQQGCRGPRGAPATPRAT